MISSTLQLYTFPVIYKRAKFIYRNKLRLWVVGYIGLRPIVLVGPGPVEGVPSLAVFLKDPNPHLDEFRSKPRKNSECLGRQARKGIEPGTSRLPVFERRTVLPLVGPKALGF